MMNVSLPTCFPLIESGGDQSELCFISNARSTKSIGCNIFGHLFFTDNAQGWEVWRITETGDDGRVLLTSWTHNKKALCSNPEGHVFTTENKHGSWEQWSIEKHTDHGLWIRSVAHNRLLAISGKQLTTISGENETCCWNLEAANYRNEFFISSKASPSDRVSCLEHGVVGTTHNREAWEVWKVGFVKPGFVVFNSHAHSQHGEYIMCKEDGGIAMTGTEKEATRWLVEQSPLGGLSFRHGSKCLSSSNGHVSTKDLSVASLEESETFLLDPNIPGTISGPQIFGLATAGVFGIATAALAPLAVMGAVGAIGFGAGGIASGSLAAGMMSAEAVAAGGAITAGGTVATLQSIGAAGLGSAGTAAAVSGGALVGGGISAASAAGILSSSKDKGGANVESAARVRRYFAGWKYW